MPNITTTKQPSSALIPSDTNALNSFKFASFTPPSPRRGEGGVRGEAVYIIAPGFIGRVK